MEEFSWGMGKWSLEGKGKWERDGVKAVGGRRREMKGLAREMMRKRRERLGTQYKWHTGEENF